MPWIDRTIFHSDERTFCNLEAGNASLAMIKIQYEDSINRYKLSLNCGSYQKARELQAHPTLDQILQTNDIVNHCLDLVTPQTFAELKHTINAIANVATELDEIKALIHNSIDELEALHSGLPSFHLPNLSFTPAPNAIGVAAALDAIGNSIQQTGMLQASHPIFLPSFHHSFMPDFHRFTEMLGALENTQGLLQALTEESGFADPTLHTAIQESFSAAQAFPSPGTSVTAQDDELSFPKETPPEYFCTLTQEIMSDPVFLKTKGKNEAPRVERKHLVRWVESHQKDPFNNQEANLNDIQSDEALKREISGFMVFMEKQKKNIDDIEKRRTKVIKRDILTYASKIMKKRFDNPSIAQESADAAICTVKHFRR